MKKLHNKTLTNEDLEISNRLSLTVRGSKIGLDEDSARLLEAIKASSSISMAAKQLKKDYRLAWMKINAIENSMRVKLVDRVLGGVGGGRANLTLEGEILLQKYLLAEKKMNSLSKSKDVLEPYLNITGSHCYALEELIRIFEKRFDGCYVEYVNIGSQKGLQSVLSGKADIAGVHLFDRKSGEYNKFLVQDPVFGKRIALIEGYLRMQGIIVKKGNPKGLTTVDDILRKDVVFINRNRGSGTRFLLDTLIERIAEKNHVHPKAIIRRIKGYDYEVRSHLEVAASVKYGKADAGIGIEAVSRVLNLTFIPLQKEKFCFVVLKRMLQKEKIRRFIRVLSSKGFKSRCHKKNIAVQFNGDLGKIIINEIAS